MDPPLATLLILFLAILINNSSCKKYVRNDVNFTLYTRENIKPQFLRVGDQNLLEESNFDASRKTIIIIHGYLDNIRQTPWATHLYKKLLYHGDYNVVLVDWSVHNRYAYLIAKRNARSIGIEISALIKYLQGILPYLVNNEASVSNVSLGGLIPQGKIWTDQKRNKVYSLIGAGSYPGYDEAMGVRNNTISVLFPGVFCFLVFSFNRWRHLEKLKRADPKEFHLIGHSLGAHIAGYAGKNTPNLGRITGLDPAGTFFENVTADKRLDKTDAKFVDVIHTDAALDVFHGFGIREPIGHVDFYPNSGNSQPGCHNYFARLTSLLQFNIFRGFAHIFFCDHLRAIEYFFSSINIQCQFVAIRCPRWKHFVEGKCGDCEQHQCAKMGFHADEYKEVFLDGETRVFFSSLSPYSPFCTYQFQIKLYLGKTATRFIGISALYLTLLGTSGQHFAPLTEGFGNFDIWEEHHFLVTTERYLGMIEAVVFRWVDDSHNDYRTNFTIPRRISKFYLEKVEVIPIQMDSGYLRHKRRSFCGNRNVSIDTNKPLLLTASEYCRLD